MRVMLDTNILISSFIFKSKKIKAETLKMKFYNFILSVFISF